MNKNKKGFTLIELLAVIVILAVIALIVTPVVTGIISKTKLSADMRSAEGYVKAAEDYFAGAQINDEKKNNLDSNIIDEVEISNGSATGDLIVNDSGKVSMAININNKCYKKAEDTNEIVVSDDMDNCTLITYTVPPDRCFETVDNGDNTVSISKYLCGNTVVTSTRIDDYNIDVAVFNKDGEFTTIEIPSIIGGKTVSSIKGDTFSATKTGAIPEPGKASGITAVKIPDSIHKVDDYAFWNGQLTNVIVPNTNFTFGKWSFGSNKITRINIPRDTTSIPDGILWSNKVSNITIPDGVTTIGSRAFYQNRLKSINIPSSVTTIATGAFLGNKITSLTIPNTVTSLGNDSFNDNQLPQDQAFIYKRTDSNGDGKITDDEINKASLISYGGSQRDNITIPTNVTKLESYAFSMTHVTSVILPNGLTSIGGFAFWCTELNTLSIPASVETIDWSSLYGITTLPTIDVDKTENSITDAPWCSTATVNWLR